MPEQILLQGRVLGIEVFLISPPGGSQTGSPPGGPHTGSPRDEDLLTGRSQWITTLCEVLPRALLAELGLARILLGSSGGGQFLLVLPGEARIAAEAFLGSAAHHIQVLGGGDLKLVWGVTENLGDWSVVRKRLNEELQRKRNTPLSQLGLRAFEPTPAANENGADSYFAGDLGLKVREARSIGWSPDRPAMISINGGKHTWDLTSNLSLDGITLARHAATSDDGHSPATLATLAQRAQGRPAWGVLRGDVDDFAIRLRRLHSIEEHVQLSVLYKQFFAGELEVLCSLPEFWRKVTILYSGGDDFAVYGSWDALILLARELERVFHRFTEENLKDFPGAEAKTISMALALAPEIGSSLHTIYEQAGYNLELAKSTDKDCIYLLGRILEWKQLAGAADLKDTILRMMEEFRSSRQFLAQLRGFYEKQVPAGGPQDTEASLNRLSRFQRRFHRVLSGTRDREFQKLRAHLVNEIVGRAAKPEPGMQPAMKAPKLRPAGLVALEWARLAAEV